MKKLSIGVATFAMVTMCMCVPAGALSFLDTFDRPDSSLVGNGWSEGTPHGDLTGLQVHNGRLAAVSGFGLIHRPIVINFPVRIRATLHPGGCWNGGSEVRDHLFTTFTIKSDAANLFSGYGINVFRGGSSDASPQVCRVVGGQTDTCTPPSTAWSSHDDVAIDVTINADGSIDGTATSGASQFSFAFGATLMRAAGSQLQVAIVTGCAGNPQAVDNLIVDGLQDVGSTSTPTATPTPTVTPNGSGTPTRTRTRGHGIGQPSGGGGGCNVSSPAAVDRRNLLVVLLPLAVCTWRRRHV